MIRLNRELIDKLALLVEQTGAFWCDACAVHDIPQSTFYDWLKKGNDELARVEKIRQTGKRSRISNNRQIHVELVRRLQSAVAASCIKDLRVISRCAEGVKVVEVTEVVNPDGTVTRKTVIKNGLPDWRAALARLERRHGKKWRGVEGDLDSAFNPVADGGRKKLADMTPAEIQNAFRGLNTADDDSEAAEYINLLSNKIPALRVEEIPLDDE